MVADGARDDDMRSKVVRNMLTSPSNPFLRSKDSCNASMSAFIFCALISKKSARSFADREMLSYCFYSRATEVYY